MTPKAHIVLLPSLGNKLEMHSQGPYTVTKVLTRRTELRVRHRGRYENNIAPIIFIC